MIDDWRIIEKVLAGDLTAFEDLVREYKSHVFKIVSNMVASKDVEEVAHEAFVRVFKDLASYQRRAPFPHWLSRVTERTCYDHWRKEKRRKAVPVSDNELQALEMEVASLRQSEDSAIERAKELLDWALEHLDPQDRLAFALLYLDGMSMEQVGKVLNWSLAKVKMRSFRARRALKKLLKNKLGK